MNTKLNVRQLCTLALLARKDNAVLGFTGKSVVSRSVERILPSLQPW